MCQVSNKCTELGIRHGSNCVKVFEAISKRKGDIKTYNTFIK